MGRDCGLSKAFFSGVCVADNAVSVHKILPLENVVLHLEVCACMGNTGLVKLIKRTGVSCYSTWNILDTVSDYVSSSCINGSEHKVNCALTPEAVSVAAWVMYSDPGQSYIGSSRGWSLCEMKTMFILLLPPRVIYRALFSAKTGS